MAVDRMALGLVLDAFVETLHEFQEVAEGEELQHLQDLERETRERAARMQAMMRPAAPVVGEAPAPLPRHPAAMEPPEGPPPLRNVTQPRGVPIVAAPAAAPAAQPAVPESPTAAPPAPPKPPNS